MSGQITPFLLIILVMLLVAAMATINIGRVSLDKTCSANGADAGSLAVASSLAGAFNALAENNKDLYYAYTRAQAGINDSYLEADQYISEAIAMLMLALITMQASQVAMLIPPDPSCFIPWIAGWPAIALNIAAIGFLFATYNEISKFNVYAVGMKDMTDQFHQDQGQAYCQNVSFMQTSYANSRKIGLNYAFSNSCIPAKLSLAQGNTFSAWLADDGPDGPYGRLTHSGTSWYSWLNKVEQEHRVSCTLNLPEITNFEINPTKASYKHITELLDTMIDRSHAIGVALLAAMVAIGLLGPVLIFGLSVTASICNKCIPIPLCVGCWVVACGAMDIAYPIMMSSLFMVVMPAIEALAAGVGMFSISSLKTLNDELLVDWERDGTTSITGPPSDCTGGHLSGTTNNYLIVKINRVILPRWTTECCVRQKHLGTTTAILPTNYPAAGIESCGTAKFDGGDVGTFNGDNAGTAAYDPAIKYDSSLQAAH